ncbi:phosphoribosylglycinamide formyltransferase [Panacibacter ginsenosidivorans]|uniref:phosphoribosylglycinamide formyltransferase n=1 Tax=Panacibacter ginsenosidivorans TaxID=1813871 RepID=UPI001CEF69E2|nr:phosphoribosylglycinamide formyltransferase [Panacibacter ginsenosidivorans]
MTNKKVRIAIFASGAGSNAKKIIEYFRKHELVEVSLIVSNKPQAGVLHIAAENKLPILLIERERFFRGDAYIQELKGHGIQFIVLAGFLWKIPDMLIKAFTGNIINIHPALLPKYGGKGMYGAFVHEAVITAKEKESGITIHFVDELYDHGDHILQVTCPVYPNDTPATLAHRIHELEHAHFPLVIEEVIMKKFS